MNGIKLPTTKSMITFVLIPKRDMLKDLKCKKKSTSSNSSKVQTEVINQNMYFNK